MQEVVISTHKLAKKRRVESGWIEFSCVLIIMTHDLFYWHRAAYFNRKYRTSFNINVADVFKVFKEFIIIFSNIENLEHKETIGIIGAILLRYSLAGNIYQLIALLIIILEIIFIFI